MYINYPPNQLNATRTFEVNEKGKNFYAFRQLQVNGRVKVVKVLSVQEGGATKEL